MSAICALTLLAGLSSTLVSPARAQSLESGTVMDAVRALKAGQYLWAPQLAPAGPMLIIINRTTQRLVVYRNGVPIAVSTVSTGRAGRRTPTGVFTILEKQVTHFSSLYDSAPMPFMERLTWDGVALHGGTLPGYPASHGCIRLPHPFAKLLYGETRLGTVVVITDSPELPRFAPAPTLGTQSPEVAPAGDGVTWFPELAPSGPVTVVISASDKKLIVLRNGKEIGSAPASLANPVERPAAYMLQTRDATGDHWMRLPLPGQDPAKPLASEVGQDVTLPEGVKETIAGILEPGATVLILPDALSATSLTRGALLESAPDKALPK
ncbi:MAG TPA: L,D-transpeptidase family protein [Sphingomonas sp.]|nr:L,D-transpeptidase family protein [Sphingomonas sp.]